MQIENIYPTHTSEEEWNELAQLAYKLLMNISASLQDHDASITMSV